MWLPDNPDKIPRFFQPCPSNDPDQLEPGMLGMKSTEQGEELWVRPPRQNEGDPEPDPFMAMSATEWSAYLVGTKSFTGITNNDTLVYEYDDTARTVTITSATAKAYYRGTEITALDFSSGWTTPTFGAGQTSPVYFSHNGTSTIVSNTAFDILNNVLLAFVPFNSDGDLLWPIREGHGPVMDGATHRDNHIGIGTLRTGGGDFTYGSFGSTTAADRRPTISECVLLDEDLTTTNPAHSTKNNYTPVFLNGATGEPKPETGSSDIVSRSTNQPYYNQWTGSAFQKTLMSNNSYAAVYTIAIPVMSDTRSQLYRFVHLAGQTNGALSSVRAEEFDNLRLGALESYSTEFVPIEKTIVQYTGGNWTVTETKKLTRGRSGSVSGSGITSVSHDDTLENLGTASSPLAIAPDIQMTIGRTFGFSDVIAGNPDAKIEQRDATLIKALTRPVTGNVNSVATSDSHVFVLGSASYDYLLKYDIHTFKKIQDYSAGGAFGGASIAYSRGTIFRTENNAVMELDADDISSNQTITATGMVSNSGSRSVDLDVFEGLLITVNLSNSHILIATRGASNYTVNDYTLTGYAGDLLAVHFDHTGTNFYVVDLDGTELYVRKYDVATRTLQASSAVIEDAFFSGMKTIGLCGTAVVLTVSNTIVIMDSDLNIISSGNAATIAESAGSFSGCVLYTASSTEIKSFQLPGMTAQTPSHSDRSVQNSSSVAELRHSTTGARIYHSDSDFQRAAIQAAAHDEYRLMYDVIESVQSTDAKITNAVPGERYLILELSASYPLHNYIFEMRSDGPRYTAPRVNDLMTIRSSDYLLKYNGTSWADVGILSRTNKNYLTGAGDTTLHYHAADRNRTNHTGTQTASTISDFDTEVSNNTDVAANTAARHSHAIIRPVSSTDEIGLADRDNTVHVTDARTADVGLAVNSAVLALDGFEFNVLVDYHATYTASLYAPVATAVWEMNGASTVIGNRTLGYKYIIEGGVPVPFGTMPTAVDNSV